LSHFAVLFLKQLLHEGLAAPDDVRDNAAGRPYVNSLVIGLLQEHNLRGPVIPGDNVVGQLALPELPRMLGLVEKQCYLLPLGHSVLIFKGSHLLTYNTRGGNIVALEQVLVGEIGLRGLEIHHLV
jgi:hypothetical protein